jgi:hypothetical protein
MGRVDGADGKETAIFGAGVWGFTSGSFDLADNAAVAFPGDFLPELAFV